MQEILAIVIGFILGVIVLSPFVPGLRPIAKTVVVAFIAALATVASGVAVALEHWKDLIAEARAERNAAAEAAAEADEAETITISLPEK